MSGRAGWGAIAGAANALQSYFAEQRAFEQKSKLYQQEQDIMQKREEALAQIRADLQDRNAGNRSDRALDRATTLEKLKSGEFSRSYKDPETGNVFAYDKNGNQVALNITSDDYQSALKSIQGGKAAQGDLAGEKTQAQIDRTKAQTANLESTTTARDNKVPSDPVAQKIRTEYMQQMRQLQQDDAKKAADAKKAGEQYTPTDPLKMQQEVLENLHYTYGPDAANAAIGNAPIPGQKRAAPATQKGTPSPNDIVAAMQAAIKAGKDPKAVEDWGQGLFQKYGYNPHSTPPDQMGPPSDQAGP